MNKEILVLGSHGPSFLKKTKTNLSLLVCKSYTIIAPGLSEVHSSHLNFVDICFERSGPRRA